MQYDIRPNPDTSGTVYVNDRPVGTLYANPYGGGIRVTIGDTVTVVGRVGNDANVTKAIRLILDSVR